MRKHKYIFYNLMNNTSFEIIIFVFGLIILVVGFICFLKEIFTSGISQNSSASEWFSGIASGMALIISMLNILIIEKQFKEDHEPRLKIFVTFSDSSYHKKTVKNNIPKHSFAMTTGRLIIDPFNVGSVAGVYRFVEICDSKLENKVKNMLNKVRFQSLSDREIIWLNNNIIHNELHPQLGKDLSGRDLILGEGKKSFQIIKPNAFGISPEIPQLDVMRKIGQRLENRKITIIYADPDLNFYYFNSLIK